MRSFEFTEFVPGLEVLDLDGMSREQWLHARQLGIGGSDVSCILHLNPYYSKRQLFYQKLGLDFSANEVHTVPTAWGTVMEDPIREMAQYYSFKAKDTEKAYLYNFSKGKKQRVIKEFPYMARNADYPFFLANTDGVDNPSEDFNTIEGITEIKTISRQMREKYKAGIVPYHMVQMGMYVAVFKPILTTDMSRIYYLEDGRQFYAHEVDWSGSDENALIQRLMEQTYDFFETLELGKDIIANGSSHSQIESGLAEIEPETDDGTAIEEWLSEKYLKKSEYVKVSIESDDLDQKMSEYLYTNERIKALTKVKQGLTNELKDFCLKKSANQVDTENHRVTWTKNTWSKGRFKVSEK